jgi:hypothetical protein
LEILIFAVRFTFQAMLGFFPQDLRDLKGDEMVGKKML